MKQLYAWIYVYRSYLLILLIGSMATAYLMLQEMHEIDVQREQIASAFIAKHASALQSTLSERLSSLESLNAFVIENAHYNLQVKEDEQQFQKRFDRFANQLHQSIDGFLSLQLAPQGVIRYLTGPENNKKALGYDLFKDDARREQIISAIYLYEQVITGPINLIQGGSAIIARKAIFSELSPNSSSDRLIYHHLLADTSLKPRNDFWGLATILFTTESLLNEAGLLDSDMNGFELALKGRHGLGEDGEVFWGKATIFDKPDHISPIHFRSGSWLLAVKNTSTYPIARVLNFAALGTLLTITLLVAVYMRQRNRSAKQRETAKDAFLAMVSHELRSPLNGVIGLTSLLNKTALDTEQRQLVESLSISSKQLSSIIGDILDFSKISAGKLELDYQAVNLASTIEDCVRITTPLAEQKDLPITVNIAPVIMEQLIMTDEIRLKQIVLNLLNNAVKFTQSGSIAVDINAIENFGEQRLIIKVTDTGVGMSAKQMTGLFEHFNQLDQTTNRKYGGTGLGLAISKSLAVLMNGDIHVQSSINKGSSFTLDLPLSLVEKNQTESETPHLAIENKISQLSILVVDDLEMNRFMMQMIIKKLGGDAALAENGIEAIHLQNEHHYDLIFMDWQMPDCDGVEATKRIRKHFNNNNPWIVALTANASTTDKQEAIESGMNDYLLKPVSVEDIQQAFERYFALADTE
ncbi:ATP-binding protein [Methylophaga sp.]|uniref:ATP-binding protein n=1 Tax=Methylophaga sp. TaxID=2024840 RepID=UPI003A948797